MSPLIRVIRISDAEGLLRLCRQIDRETSFMVLEPGERSTTVAAQRISIQRTLTQRNRTMFVIEHEGRLVGYLGARGEPYSRIRHSVVLVVGILEAFTGRGLGARLFGELDQWAHSRELHRLELTVMTTNRRAIRLYEQAGFEIEGVRRHSLCVDGVYADEYFMAKLLE